MTSMRDCSVEDGRIFAANNGRRVTIGGRSAILLHNSWTDLSTGEYHQVGLDLRTDPAMAAGDASPECQRLARQYFTDIADRQEWQITQEYIESMPEIYRDILAVFPEVEPARKAGDCLAFQTLYSALREKYGLGEIRTACEQLADGNAMVIRNRMFACPTKLGEEIIAKLSGQTVPMRHEVPPFSPPPVSA